MTRSPLTPILVALLLATPARAQDATLQGTCERLVIADQDLTATCNGSLLRLSAPTFEAFSFSASDGRTLSFTGDRPEDAGKASTWPVKLVAQGLSGKDGISRSTYLATGACRLSTPEPDGTAIACEASAQGKRYAGSFLARKSDAGAAKP